MLGQERTLTSPIGKGSKDDPSYWTASVMPSWNDMIILRSFGVGVGASNSEQQGEEAGLTYWVKCLGQVDEGEEEETPLFAALLLQLPDGEHHALLLQSLRSPLFL